MIAKQLRLCFNLVARFEIDITPGQIVVLIGRFDHLNRWILGRWLSKRSGDLLQEVHGRAPRSQWKPLF